MAITPATSTKRRQLEQAISQLLSPAPCVQGVIAVGSVALGEARPDSDIDALVFMDPIDDFVVPRESIWCPWDDSFHSIFSQDDRVQTEGIPLDFEILDLKDWSDPEFFVSEPQRAGLAAGWIAFDRNGKVTQLVSKRTHYDDATRVRKIDSAVTHLDQHLKEGTPERNWETLGALIASDRLTAAYADLVDLLFACNRRWRFWPERQMSYLMRLPWLPNRFETRVLVAMNPPSLGRGGFINRVQTLRTLFREVLDKLTDEGFYGGDAVGEAFVRNHQDEPGRSWNMDQWNARRVKPR